MAEQVAEQPDVWVRAKAHLVQEKKAPSLAERIFQKAAERTLEITIMGELVACHWPGKTMREAMIDAVGRVETLMRNLRSAPDHADTSEVTQAIETMSQEVARLAAELTKDPSFTEESFLHDDHGLELATRILITAISKANEQTGEARSFRGDVGRPDPR